MNRIRSLWWRFRLRSRMRGPRYADAPGREGRPRCFVCLAADYGNLGDVAITYAQERFLRERFPQYDIVEWPISRTVVGMRTLRRAVRPGDIITITGGGNMGDMYYDIELCRLLMVRAFPHNRVIVFPQTVSYGTGPEAAYLKRLSRRVYSAHPDLTLMAREQRSYETMQRLYPGVRVLLKPDIVMTLDLREPSAERRGVLLCLRNDREKAAEAVDIPRLLATAGMAAEPLTEYDTHLGRDGLSPEERIAELQKIWTTFRHSRLVVTDRLHGMIFAYITGTPALVLPNNNHKIEGCYRWIADCGYIHLMDGAPQPPESAPRVTMQRITKLFDTL